LSCRYCLRRAPCNQPAYFIGLAQRALSMGLPVSCLRSTHHILHLSGRNVSLFLTAKPPNSFRLNLHAIVPICHPQLPSVPLALALSLCLFPVHRGRLVPVNSDDYLALSLDQFLDHTFSLLQRPFRLNASSL
jgi:hypothetical protein